MLEHSLSSCGRAALLAAVTLLLALEPHAADARIKQTNLSVAAGARVTGVNGSAATGRCLLLVTSVRTKALGHCTIEGGAPLTSIRLLVDGFDTPVLVTPVSDSGPVTFVIDPLPAVVVRALSAGALRFEAHTSAGLEARGTVAKATNSVQLFVQLRAAEAVPPGSTNAAGLCIVTIAFAPPFLGVDCVHDLPDPQSLTLHRGFAQETGDVSLDLSAALGGRNPAAWEPLETELLFEIAADGTYLRMEGAGGGDVIRGQVDGCRTTNTTACIFGRFTVEAIGQSNDASVPTVPARVETLSAPFDSLVGDANVAAQTQTVLFSLTADNDHSLLVEMIDGCNLRQGIILNAVGTDFESYRYIVTFGDLFFGTLDSLLTHATAPVNRRASILLPCLIQTSQ